MGASTTKTSEPLKISMGYEELWKIILCYGGYSMMGYEIKS